MKRNRFVAMIMAVICICLMIVPAVAVQTRASDQIMKYSVDVTPCGIVLTVRFSVTGTGVKSKLGCESINVYQKSGSSWKLSESWSESDTGTTKKNTTLYVNTITCGGKAGTEYKVVVTIFAEDSAGRDSRTTTTYVTGKA